MINIKELTFRYRGRGPNLSSSFGMCVAEFTVPLGASTALVGPSGSGKTTLLGLIAGTLRADSGSIHVNDQAITGFNDGELGRYRIRNVGQVFQAFELLGYLTVIENIMLPWYIAGSGRKSDIRKRAADLLLSVGLESKQSAMPGELSQGEQQRVAVCRAMLNNPSVLLADEPTGNLDRENKQNVVDLLVEQARRNNSTLLMVTHDESLLDKFDSVLDMRQVAVPYDAESQR
jgi:putative ABC transport system ATP-binding protein